MFILFTAIVALSNGADPADVSPPLRSAGKAHPAIYVGQQRPATVSPFHRSLKWNNNFYKTEEEKQQIQEEYEQQQQQEQEEYEKQLQQEQEEYEQYVEEKKQKAEEGQTDTNNMAFYGYGYDETGYGYSGVETGLTYEEFGDATTVVAQAQGGAARPPQQKWMIASGVLMAVSSLVAVGMYMFARRKATTPPTPVEKNFSLMDDETKVDIA